MELLKVESNATLGIKINVYGTPDKPMFNAGEVALLLWAPQRVYKGNPTPDMNKLRKALSINVVVTTPQFTKDNYITESQYYKAVLKSQSPLADPIYDWLSVDVLPTIRKTGGYIRTNDISSSKEFKERVSAVVKEATKKFQIEINELEDSLEEAEEIIDTVGDVDNYITMKAFSKMINIPFVGRNSLIQLLKEASVLNNDGEPYQRYINNEWFITKDTKIAMGRTHKLRLQTFVNPGKCIEIKRKVISQINKKQF